MLIFFVTLASIFAYVWLVPEDGRKTHIKLDPTVNANKTDVVGPLVITTKQTTPTPKGSATPKPGTKATTPAGQSYTGHCDNRSPYGFTTMNADSTLVGYYQQMNVCWVRLQIHESALQKSDGSYDFTVLDGIVGLMNSKHIHIDLPLECFNGPSGKGNSNCFSGSTYIPTAAEMKDFATQIAIRYNGRVGSAGYIDAYEILNEEPDFGINAGIFDIANYCPILQAGYAAIKAPTASPTAIVGMFGTFPTNPDYTAAVLNAIFKGGCGSSMDFLNFHYYNGGHDPSIVYDATHPTFDQKWQIIHNVAAQNGYGNKPIWVTETGWTIAPLGPIAPVTPDQQSQYLQYVSIHAGQSGTIQRIFWYTINMGDQTNSIYPTSKGPLPAFSALTNLVKQHPLWPY